MIILFLIIGILIGFFISAIYYMIIIDTMIDEFIKGGIYENRKNKN